MSSVGRDRSGPVCVLVGPPGAGKSTVGRLLAAALRVDFRDTDEVVETVAGKPVPDIFIDDGEERFRELEREAVARSLREFGGVLALGGGALLSEATRTALSGHTVVFLSVELPDAVRRVGLGQGRPLLAVNPRAVLRHQLEQRRPLYRRVASVTVATDGRTPEEVVDEIVAFLGRADGDAGRAGGDA